MMLLLNSPLAGFKSAAPGERAGLSRPGKAGAKRMPRRLPAPEAALPSGALSGYWAKRLLSPGTAGTDAGPSPGQGISRLDRWYPFFCGAVLWSLAAVFFLVPRLSARFPGAFPAAAARSAPELLPEAPDAGEAPDILPPDIPPESWFLNPDGAVPDPIQAHWQDPRRQKGVIAFFAGLTRSEHLSLCILTNAKIFGIPPALAFALCWEESRFNPGAVNRANRNRTVDRGLFQLNSSSFPSLAEEEFFDIRLNTYYGMAHLRHCLDQGGSIVAALAMYNAGTGRVNGESGTPRHTLDYIARILRTTRIIERLYYDYAPSPEIPAEPEAEIAELSAPGPRLARLSSALRRTD